MTFLLLTAKLLFCWEKSYKFDERMTTGPVKRVGSSVNNLLSLGNPRGYFWVKPLRTFPELLVILSFKCLVTRKHFRVTVDKHITGFSCKLQFSALSDIPDLTVYRANSPIPKMVGVHKLQDFIFIYSEKNPASRITVMFLSPPYPLP